MRNLTYKAFFYISAMLCLIYFQEKQVDNQTAGLRAPS